MINQAIVVGIMLVIGIALIVLDSAWWAAYWPSIISVILLSVVVLWGGWLIIRKYQVPMEINNFSRQKIYIETHIPKNDIEDAALTQTKIELNNWLYNTQFMKEKFNAWSLYPDSIIDFEPIQ